jgi:hydrogenase nickel incorporation protein HypA/HybF
MNIRIHFNNKKNILHELSIAQDIIEIVKQYVPDQSIVLSVKVEIGKLSNIMSDSLLFGYEALTKETFLKNSSLNIREIPVRIICKNCGVDEESEPTFLFCPKCESGNVEVISGKDIKVVEIEILDK